ncbi:MAG: 6-pyruvoyl tetrahydropterin synthase family protein [Planctomycetes bacterium]|nr:6-pyruvoyl tetrahydropterin synthase family protein [Planctomycetota bacterium]
MFRIVKRLRFCFGHRIPGHPGKCARLHGHEALLEVELASDRLDALGMVRDFADVKRRVQAILDEGFDHRTLLHRDDPLVAALRAAGEEPVVLDENPTAENIARRILLEARERGLPVACVRLWETPDSYAEHAP